MTSEQVAAHQARVMAGRSVPPTDLAAVDTESQLHGQIFGECRRRGWIVFHGAMSERTHRTAGEPDFSIRADDGRVFDIECKSRTGKLSVAQSAMVHHAKTLGHTIHVVRSFAEFLKIIDAKKL